MSLPTLEDIQGYNPWLDNGTFEVPDYQRPIFQSIANTVNARKFIVALTGLRRIGKTTLMKQLTHQIHTEKFFFTFEEDAHANYDALKHVIETFLRLSSAKPFIFLDEIGRIKGWAGLLKKYHDLGKAYFVISGSSSINITKGKESLAGRLMEFDLTPWSFTEFISCKGIQIKVPKFNSIEASYLSWKSQSQEISEFLRKGGFPDLFSIKDETLIRKYIKSTTIDKIIFEDLPKTFFIEEINKLYSLMEYLAKETGNIFIASHIGQAFELSKDTVQKYLLYLKYVYLADIIPREGSSLKSFKRPKKVYTTAPAISYGMDPKISESKLAETAVCQKLRQYSPNVFFYRDPQQREVDFTGGIIAEVKWTDTVLKEDYHNLLYYLEKKGKKIGFLVTKTQFARKEINNKTIYIVPLDFFLALED